MQAQSYQHPAVRDLINRYVRVYQNDYVLGMDLVPVLAPEAQLRSTLTLERIVIEVAEEFAVSVVELVSSRRSAFIVGPRQAYYWLAKELTGKALTVVGKYLGGRDHTTVAWGVKSCERRMEADPDYKFMVLAVRRRLEGRA